MKNIQINMFLLIILIIEVMTHMSEHDSNKTLKYSFTCDDLIVRAQILT